MPPWPSIRAWLVYSNGLIALTALALSLETIGWLRLPPTLYGYGPFAAGATLLVYALHYGYKLRQGHTDDRLDWYRRHPRVLPVSGTLGALLALGAAISGLASGSAPRFSDAFVPLTALAALLTLAYSFPLWPGRIPAARKIGGLKLVYLSALWTFNTLLVPGLLQPAGLLEKTGPAALILYLLHRFFFIAAVALLFNVYDEAEDRQAGIATFAVTAGAARILKQGAWLSLFLNGALAQALFGIADGPGMLVLTALLIPVLLLFFGYRCFRATLPEDAFAFRYDSLLLIKALLLIFAQYFTPL